MTDEEHDRAEHARAETDERSERAWAATVQSPVDDFLSTFRPAANAEAAAEAMQKLAAAAAGLNVPKTARNPQGNYQYASHDDVKKAVGLIAGPLGLKPHVTMLTSAQGSAHWGKGAGVERFTFGCCWTFGGYRCSPISRIEIVVYASGAQAFGAAQSYATKEWLKSDLLIDTGEPDADHQQHTTEPAPAAGLPDGHVAAAVAKQTLIDEFGIAVAKDLWGDRGSNPITDADLAGLVTAAQAATEPWPQTEGDVQDALAGVAAAPAAMFEAASDE